MDEHISKDNNNPINWDGNNRKCKLCDKDAENMDEYCQDHQPCIMCNENDYCNCEDEWSNVSSCCEAKMETDMKMCYKCKDHCDSVWETVSEQRNTNNKN